MNNNCNKKIYDVYINYLIKWQKSFNIIGNSTIDDIKNRHFADSFQLNNYIPKDTNINIFDLGSGAGFPGMILAISNQEKQVYLVEKDFKKSTFLNNIKRELNINNVTILNDDINNISHQYPKQADIVTARALSSLDNLIKFSKPLLKNKGYCLFLKGKSYKEELDNVRVNTFDLEVFDSQTDSEGKILKVRNIVD